MHVQGLESRALRGSAHAVDSHVPCRVLFEWRGSRGCDSPIVEEGIEVQVQKLVGLAKSVPVRARTGRFERIRLISPLSAKHNIIESKFAIIETLDYKGSQ